MPEEDGPGGLIHGWYYTGVQAAKVRLLIQDALMHYYASEEPPYLNSAEMIMEALFDSAHVVVDSFVEQNKMTYSIDRGKHAHQSYQLKNRPIATPGGEK